MKHRLIALACLFFALTTAAQDSTSVRARLYRFARQANVFNKEFTQEKVYLHFDNTGYFLGETLWYKAYVVRATDHAFTDMSKTLYVDLIDPEGYVLQHTILRIIDGVCNGEFLLRDSLKAGFYEVRAYTRCMMNFGPEVVFSRVFPVYDAPKVDGNFDERAMTFRPFTIPDKRVKAERRDRVNLTFYPEGGNLVAGLESKVAFKVTDKQGKNLDVSGNIFNSKGEEIIGFQTQHDGMGYFPLLPDGGKYIAKVVCDGRESKFELPTAEPAGYGMTAFNLNKKNLRLLVRKSSAIPDADTLALVLSCRGKILDFNLLTVGEEGKLFAYDKSSLPAGVNQFTLYDAEGRIRSERLVFVHPTDTDQVVVKTDKEQYKPYEKIRLSLTLPAAATSENSSLSISVRDAASSNFGNSDNGNLATNLLLASDLKGYIADPAWYFADTTVERMLGMDLLMLTQGWRRFSWKRQEGLEPFEAKHPIEEGILMDGKVISLLGKKEKKDIGVLFWMTQGLQAFRGNCVTDENGNFNFLLDMDGKWDLNLQTKLEDKRKEYRILLNRAFSPEPRSYIGYDREVWTDNSLKVPEPIPDSTAWMLGEVRYATEIKPTNPEGYKEYTLKEVVKTAKRVTSMQQEAMRKASVGYEVSQIADAHRDVGESEAPTILEMLQEENTYFSIMMKEEGRMEYRYKGKPVHFLFDNTPSEETNVRKVEELMGDEIEKVMIVEDQKVVRYYYPTDDREYVIILLRFFKNGIQPREPIGIRRTTFQGYTRSAEFYSPLYPSGVPILEADHRRTLYWNPDIRPDAEGKVQLELYNNGNANKPVIRVEGLSPEGLPLLNR